MRDRSPIPVQDALETVLATVSRPVVEEVPLAASLGRTLARDLHALADHPNVANSALDGFACRASDTEGATAARPVRLRVIGEVPAGALFPGTVGPAEAVAIYTGGPLPDGADAIAPVEATTRDGDTVAVRQPARRGDVRPRAQDLRQGQLGLERGRRLDATALALAAGMGHAVAAVARPPRVAVLTTGNELVQPGGILAPGQVYDANAAGIAALVRAAGGEPTVLPAVSDDMDRLAASLDRSADFDLILTSGGVSMGRWDLVRDLMFSRGEVLFWKVAMKPGGPTLFGTFEGVPLLGLPGNPVSSLVVFLLLGRAFVEASLGRTQDPPYLRRKSVTAGEAMAAAGGKETFPRVRLAAEGERTYATATGSQNSGILRSMVEADALAVIPPHSAVSEGSPVEVIPLEPLVR